MNYYELSKIYEYMLNQIGFSVSIEKSMFVIFYRRIYRDSPPYKYWMKNSGSAERDDECTGLERV